ncbi:prepilin peptidase [Microbacterium indicum]|uniref:prepilin peptidase n=1 Tax=Microbacterium indicum TaxID=358100 RepID=UPI0004107E44|nr:A24 family peptidase [Microbacterium indicum]
MSDPLALAALLVFAGVGGWLCHIDIAEHRLPNAIVLPLAGGILALALAASVAEGSPATLVRAAAGALALGGGYALLRVASRGGLGGGDIKLALPTGAVLAWQGWPAFALGSALAFVVGSAWAAGLIATRRGSRDTRIAFGPCMILGACVGPALV